MRLIDCEPLKADLLESKEKLWEIYNGLSHHVDKQICAGEIATFQETILRINKAPAIEAEPVKHGRWIFDDYTKRLRCSECEAYKPYEVVADYIDYWDCDYCPNCGARMDGDSDA